MMVHLRSAANGEGIVLYLQNHCLWEQLQVPGPHSHIKGESQTRSLSYLYVYICYVPTKEVQVLFCAKKNLLIGYFP